jgi:transcription elongation factor GreB
VSRAFTKEDSWEEPRVPPRAALPPGVPNYVTPRGRALLADEHAALEAERARLEADVPDEEARRTRRAVLTRQLEDLRARIANAEVVDPARQPHDTVRFGAHVTLSSGAGDDASRSFQIVGVDEADPDAGRISFLAPLARAVLGKAVGESIEFRGEQLTVEAIAYATDLPQGR